MLWKWAFTASVEVFIFNIVLPVGAVRFGMNRLAEVALGIAVSVAFNMLLWPNRAEDVFRKQVQEVLRGCARLCFLKREALAGRTGELLEARSLEEQLFASATKLRKLYEEALHDSGRFQTRQRRYAELMIQLEILVNDTVSLDLYFKHSGRAVAPTSPAQDTTQAFHSLMASLEHQFENLADVLSEAGHEAAFEAESERSAACLEQLDAEAADLTSRSRTALDAGLFHSTLSQMRRCLEQVRRVKGTLQTLAGKPLAGEQFAPLQELEVPDSFSVRSIAMHKSAVSLFVTVVLMSLWMATGFPAGPKAILTALLICRFNVIMPYIPAKGLFFGIFTGTVMSSVIYLCVLPQLGSYWELCCVLFPFYFYFSRFTLLSDANKNVFGIFVMYMLASGLSLTTPNQSIDIMGWLYGNLAVMVGCLAGIMAMRVLWPIIPGDLFRKAVASFFASSRRFISEKKDLAAYVQHKDQVLHAFRRQSRRTLDVCALWGSMLDPKSGLAENTAQVQALLDSMNKVAIQLHNLQRNRQRWADHPLKESLRKTSRQLREVYAGTMAAYEEVATGALPSPQMPDRSNLLERLEGYLDLFRQETNADDPSGKLARQMIERFGHYAALEEAMSECHDRFSSLHWTREEDRPLSFLAPRPYARGRP